MRGFQRPGENELQGRRKHQLQGMIREWGTLPEMDGNLENAVLQMDGSGLGPSFLRFLFSSCEPLSPSPEQPEQVAVFTRVPPMRTELSVGQRRKGEKLEVLL